MFYIWAKLLIIYITISQTAVFIVNILYLFYFNIHVLTKVYYKNYYQPSDITVNMVNNKEIISYIWKIIKHDLYILFIFNFNYHL